MKRKMLSICTLLFALCLMCGCGKKITETETTITIDGSGAVTQVIVDSFDESVYSADDFKAYVDNAVSSYIAKNGEESVTLDQLTIEEGVCKMKMLFPSISAYQSFNNVDFYMGSVSGAIAAGYDFDDYFTSVNDGMLQSSDASGDVASADASANGSDQVFIVEESGLYQFSGTIKTVSSQGVEVVTSSSVRVNADAKDGGVFYIIYQ